MKIKLTHTTFYLITSGSLISGIGAAKTGFTCNSMELNPIKCRSVLLGNLLTVTEENLAFKL